MYGLGRVRILTKIRLKLNFDRFSTEKMSNFIFNRLLMSIRTRPNSIDRNYEKANQEKFLYLKKHTYLNIKKLFNYDQKVNPFFFSRFAEFRDRLNFPHRIAEIFLENFNLFPN